MNSTQFGDYRFGVNLFSDSSANPFTPAPIPDDINSQVVIIIYDHSTGNKKMIFSDAMQENPIKDIQFSFTENGCGNFTFTLTHRPATFAGGPAEEIGYKNRVEIYLFKSATPWFSGVIESRPHPKMTETESQKYGGYGFFNQLDVCIVDKTYEANQQLEDIITDMLFTFVIPKTDVEYITHKVSPTGIRTAGPLQFQKTKAKSAFKTITDIAQNYVFGVDEFRHFFFRPVEPSVRQEAIKHVSKHIKSFPIQEDPSKIANRIYIKGGSINNKSNFLVTVEDIVSQTLYGLIEVVMTAPEILNVDDAIRWGNYQLSQLKEVKQKASIKQVDFNGTLIKPEGKARIWIEDAGINDFIDLFIKKTSYTVSGNGIILDMDLGEIDQPVEQHILDLLREVKNQALLQEANVKNLS